MKYSASIFFASAAMACGGPSATVRPDVPPEPVTVVNDSTVTSAFAHASAGLEPGPDIEIRPGQCAVVNPPSGRTGELRVQIRDADQNVLADLYGRQLTRTWSSCTCSLGRFSRCLHAPAPPARRP